MNTLKTGIAKQGGEARNFQPPLEDSLAALTQLPEGG